MNWWNIWIALFLYQANLGSSNYLYKIRPCLWDANQLARAKACVEYNSASISAQGNIAQGMPVTPPIVHRGSWLYYKTLPRIGWAETLIVARNVDLLQQFATLLKSSERMPLLFQGLYGWAHVLLAILAALWLTFFFIPLCFVDRALRSKYVIFAHHRPKTRPWVIHAICGATMIGCIVMIGLMGESIRKWQQYKRIILRTPFDSVAEMTFGEYGLAQVIEKLKSVNKRLTDFSYLALEADASPALIDARHEIQILTQLIYRILGILNNLVLFAGKFYSEGAKVSAQFANDLFQVRLGNLFLGLFLSACIALLLASFVYARYWTICNDSRIFKHTNPIWLRYSKFVIFTTSVVLIILWICGGSILGIAAFPTDICGSMTTKLAEQDWNSLPLIGGSALKSAVTKNCLRPQLEEGNMVARIGGALYTKTVSTIQQITDVDDDIRDLKDTVSELELPWLECQFAGEIIEDQIDMICSTILSSIVNAAMFICIIGWFLAVVLVMVYNFWIRRQRLYDCYGYNKSEVDEKLFFKACITGDLATVERALMKFTPDTVTDDVHSNSPLHFAAYHGHVEIVNRLCDAGWDPNKLNFRGHTPFTACVSNTELEQSKKIETVQVLKEHDADIDIYTGDGDTPLMIATRLQEEHLVAYLVEWGADPYKEDWTYRWNCIKMAKRLKSQKIGKLLLSKYENSS